jgi:hypothetical protein
MNITLKTLKNLIRKYQSKFSLKGYSKLKKVDLIEFVRKHNYKVFYNEDTEKHELHPIKDPSRNPKLKQ